MNIAQYLERCARLFPDRPALVFEDTTYTYAGLDTLASRFAHALRGLGIERGDRVALFLPNIPAFAIAYYGIQKLGAIAVSVNARSTAAEVRFVLDDCAAKVVVTTEAFRSHVPDDGVPHLQHIVIAEGNAGDERALPALLDGTSGEVDALDMDRTDPAVILYTSGTTGAPKGATLSHGNVVSNMWSFVHNCGMTPEDRLLLHLPLFHCFGQNALMNSTLLAGATLVLQRGFRPDTVLQAVEEHAITMFFGVPTMFLALLDRATPEGMRSVRYYFSAAASLPDEVERRWHEKFGRIITQGYGLTETSPFASYNHFLQYRHGSIGAPIENVEMKVVDVETGADVSPGELGEIVIKGPNVMLGYWNRPDATAQVLRNGWFHSGDIGRMDTDGYFYIADRLKDMIDVGGMNVYPVEVENVLYQHEAVAEAAVFGVPDDLMGEQVWAHVVLKPNTTIHPDHLQTFCLARLADFKAPRVLECVEELPKNPAGKILKRVLREQAAARMPAANSATFADVYYATAPSRRRAVLQEFLCAELALTLDLPMEQIDADEPLTDLGLESLMAVDLGAHLREQLGLGLSVMVLVNGGTLGSLTDTLATALDEAAPVRV